MQITVLKLVLTPILIALVTLAGRRWGPRVSGLLTGLPLTSGPVSLILAIEHGTPFAVGAAAGTLCGQASVCFFCLVYALAARRRGWIVSSAAGMCAFFAATAGWDVLAPSVPVAACILCAVIVGVFLAMRPRVVAPARAAPPRWDLPARMGAAAGFVFLITAAAQALGPLLSGLLSPYPVFGNVMASFTHKQQGEAAAASLLRAVVVGSFGFVGFFLVVGTCLPRLGLPTTYSLAALAAAAASVGPAFAVSAALRQRGAE